MDTLYNKKLVAEGINFLRLMAQGQRIPQIAQGMGYEEERIKSAIAAARHHKDEAEKPPKVKLTPPVVVPFRDPVTGMKQAVKEVTIEVMRDITPHWSEEGQSEYTALLPVKITIKRI